MKHPMTSQWNVTKLSQWYVFRTSYWYVVSRRPNDEVPSVRLHDVSNKSQIKHPTTSQWYVAKTSQWYVSTLSQSYVVATPCLYYRLYYVFKLLCHDLQLVGFHVSFKHQIKHHIFLVPTRRE